jgi:cardiolipin synthase
MEAELTANPSTERGPTPLFGLKGYRLFRIFGFDVKLILIMPRRFVALVHMADLASALSLICALGAAGGCATLPEADPLAETQYFSHPPTVAGASGVLSEQRAKALLAQAKEGGKGESDVLDRHVAYEEEIAGVPLSAGNEVTLLYDGPATYKAMFDAIEQAHEHVNLELYIFEADEIGERFADLLIRKRKQGIAVNLIYDSVGSIDTPPEFFQRLRAAGIRVLEFNPLNPLLLKKGWRINHRDHRKIVIVDGRLAFIGGINISDVYSRGSSPRSAARHRGAPVPGWRDTNVRIAGPAVAELQKLFFDNWDSQKGEPLPANDWFPTLKAKGQHLVRVIGSSPDDAAPAIYLTLLSAIDHAERTVYLTMAYFVPDRQTLDALTQAARRGVDVKLVLPSHSDFWAVFHAGRSHYAELLDAGVQVWERQDALLHAKTAVIDGVWSTVGSSNMDWRSFLHNDEVNAVVLGTNFAREMEAMFERDLANSVRIDAEQWADRPLSDRLKEWAARIWEYWL